MKDTLIKRPDALQNEHLSKLPESKAEQLRNVFVPMCDTLTVFEQRYSNVIESHKTEPENPEIHKTARELRLEIKKIRTSTEKARKEQKSYFLIAGKAIDGIANILKYSVADMEEKLSEIENYFENKERERINSLYSVRSALVQPFMLGGEEIRADLGIMDDDLFNAYLNNKKTSYEEFIKLQKEKEQKERDEREAKDREIAELKAKHEKAEKEKREAEKIIKEQRAQEDLRHSSSDLPKLKIMFEDIEKIYNMKFKSNFGNDVASEFYKATFEIHSALNDKIQKEEK
jgi:hypothetical protein